MDSVCAFSGRRASSAPSVQERNIVPDTAEYLARIRQLAQTKDPLALQEETAGVLARLISDASEDRMKTRPRKDKWSVAEILAHLADDEIATAWRYRQMVEHSGIELVGF